MLRFLLPALLALLFLTTGSRADDSTVYTEGGARQAEHLMEELELKFEEVEAGTYKFQLQGYTVLLFSKTGDMQLYAGFKGKKVTLSRINEWNKTKRFSRAYLDNKGDVAFESDLDIEGGVTMKSMKNFVILYGKTLKAFAEFIK